MRMKVFITNQIREIMGGERKINIRKIKSGIIYIKSNIFCLPAIPFVILIRFLRPILLVRWGNLISSRIGHFAANTELYLCEQDAGINKPKCRYVDVFYMGYKPISNIVLANMWERHLLIAPSWLMTPIAMANKLIPGGRIHEIGNNIQNDRDINNLMNKFPPHLQFTEEEELRGKEGLVKIGIKLGSPFVCLLVRDSSYLSTHLGKDFNYHNYRDTDVQNYVLAAEELASRGYFVIRMGVYVKKAINSTSPKVIDYATNGMRTDFMDIYLGAKCSFCISVGSGFDAIPYIFHRPTVYVNMVPLGYLWTFRENSIGITKHYFNRRLGKELTLNEIFNHGIGFSVYTADYESKDIELVENTPEEIRDVVIEMAERLNGSWQSVGDDEYLQKLFWKIFPVNAYDLRGVRLHGEVKIYFGAKFLRNNRNWLGLKSATYKTSAIEDATS